MKIYQFQVLGDCEGRTMRTVGYFRNRNDAHKLYDSGYGNYGNSRDMAIREIVVFDSLVDFAAASPNITSKDLESMLGPEEAKTMLRQRAMAKLTPEERKALGL